MYNHNIHDILPSSVTHSYRSNTKVANILPCANVQVLATVTVIAVTPLWVERKEYVFLKYSCVSLLCLMLLIVPNSDFIHGRRLNFLHFPQLSFGIWSGR